MLEIQPLVSMHAYWVVALIVGLESAGLPLPGETILILAAIYAGTDPTFNLWMLILAAAFGAIAGDNIGYGLLHPPINLLNLRLWLRIDQLHALAF